MSESNTNIPLPEKPLPSLTRGQHALFTMSQLTAYGKQCLDLGYENGAQAAIQITEKQKSIPADVPDYFAGVFGGKK